jgi:hypothetical protein
MEGQKEGSKGKQNEKTKGGNKTVSKVSSLALSKDVCKRHSFSILFQSCISTLFG